MSVAEVLVVACTPLQRSQPQEEEIQGLLHHTPAPNIEQPLCLQHGVPTVTTDFLLQQRGVQ